MSSRSIALSLPSLAPIMAGLRRFARDVVVVQRVVASRRHLAEMEPRMLSDIGITHAQAVAEARRAPWDISACARRR